MVYLSDVLNGLFDMAAFAQDFHDQEEAGQEDEAEQAYPLLDPHAHRQHHQVKHVFFIICIRFCFYFIFKVFSEHVLMGSFQMFFLGCRYNAKRRHWRRTKLGF